MRPDVWPNPSIPLFQQKVDFGAAGQRDIASGFRTVQVFVPKMQFVVRELGLMLVFFDLETIGMGEATLHSRRSNVLLPMVSKSKKTAKQNDGLTLLKGEFVYYDGAAVLQTHADIYGVLITDQLEALNTEAKKYKTQPTDMVEVEIRGKITNTKHDKILWENKVEVVEILSVKPIAKEAVSTLNLGNQ